VIFIVNTGATASSRAEMPTPAVKGRKCSSASGIPSGDRATTERWTGPWSQGGGCLIAEDPQHAFPGHGQMKPEQLEIARLKREVVKLKAERDILKKAAANFAKEST
jgi:transposase-like protein